ncbi:MAG: MBOAT family protein [Bacteroidota bacterium]
MLFNSIDFAIFLPVVFIVYWFVANRNLRFQNTLLLAASYFFYACWDYRFLGLLLFSTALDYLTGITLQGAKRSRKRKTWLWISIIINVGLLGVFKYFNFFATSFADGLSSLGIRTNIRTLELILPLGISFYTFHGLSYVLDVYKGKTKAERNFIDYAVFVSFFPLLVAGPIERATHLLPQIKKKREFGYTRTVDGLRQILWGLFKKVVIADNCADYANLIFNNPGGYHGSTLVIGAVFFAFQIYCDFSGYSDIAIGTAKLFGIDLLRNFAFPYFSRNIAEFWRRWHISLSSWFRDYLYIPLGGSRGGIWMKLRNIFIIFLVSGFWHGANWTFIVWGLLNVIYMMPSIIWKTNRNHLEIVAKGKWLPTVKEFFSMVVTFTLVLFAWIFFRALNVHQAFHYISGIFSSSLLTIPEVRPVYLMLLVSIFILIEWLGREGQYAIQHTGHSWYKPFRWSFYLVLTVSIFINLGREQVFFYFQY